jgi:16S rRNA (guanine(966)-N(2))-methyltransferase RsmD
MRIVAGKFGSRILKPVRDLALRPTSDRLRETLFNVLGNAVAGSVFVDCYAGTGAVGIEALSRGARQVIFIEKHGATAGLIRENLVALGVNTSMARGVAPEAELMNTDARRGLSQLTERQLHADFIFVDPPYDEMGQCVKVLERVADSKVAERLLGARGTLIVEHGARVRVPESMGALNRVRILKQGDSALSFFVWRDLTEAASLAAQL